MSRRAAAPEPEPGSPAELDAIADDLADDGVYVHPSLSSEFTDDQLADLEAGLEQLDDPTYVVAYPLRANDVYSGSGKDLLTRLHDRHPEPGAYLVTTTVLRETEYQTVRIEGLQWGLTGGGDGDLDPYEVLSTVGYEEPATLGEAFVRATELLDLPREDLVEVHEAAQQQYRTSSEYGGGYPGDSGDGDGAPVGTVVVVLAVVAVAVLALKALRARASSRRSRAPQRFTLPPSARAHIREAHDRALERRARADLLALGEEIDVTEIAGHHDRVSWQHALDHHDAARRVLGGNDSRPDVLDVVGAIVLAGRGRDALDAARRGRAWTPRPPCYLNPLHEGRTERRRVDDVEVPLCGACRTALAAGDQPEALDVERDGRPVHYFETDSEPWASTGYGALQPDLVKALHGERR